MNDIDLQQLKEQWFYVIRTDDWDRYLWEVYANNEMVTIESSENRAYCRLWELIEAANEWTLEEQIKELYN
jgi:hypothetical protein